MMTVTKFQTILEIDNNYHQSTKKWWTNLLFTDNYINFNTLKIQFKCINKGMVTVTKFQATPKIDNNCHQSASKWWTNLLFIDNYINFNTLTIQFKYIDKGMVSVTKFQAAPEIDNKFHQSARKWWHIERRNCQLLIITINNCHRSQVQIENNISYNKLLIKYLIIK